MMSLPLQGVIYARFKDRFLEWRFCYKALLLSEFLIKKGPMVSTGLGAPKATTALKQVCV